MKFRRRQRPGDYVNPVLANQLRYRIDGHKYSEEGELPHYPV